MGRKDYVMKIITKIGSLLFALVMIVGLLPTTAFAADARQSTANSASIEETLAALSEEYGMDIQLASAEEMAILGFVPAGRSNNVLDVDVIEEAIKINQIATAEAESKMQADDWVNYTLAKGQTYVSVISSDGQALSNMSGAKAASRIYYYKPWYPNGGDAILDCMYDTSTCIVGTVYGLGWANYTPYEGTYHIIPATIGYRRIDGGRHVEMSCTGNYYVVSGGQLVKLGTASRTATIPC